MACLLGPIPAGAGETWSRPMPQSDQRAYPRWRGGNAHQGVTPLDFEGLSPLARGKHRRRLAVRATAGPIPAGAGETMAGCGLPGGRGAYPRWRGGNPAIKPLSCLLAGLSPLARGKLMPVTPTHVARGPIPAGAGETRRPRRPSASTRAYPRWRGGNSNYRYGAAFVKGLSPLARGKRMALAWAGAWLGPIPAGAGETGPFRWWWSARGAYPRWRGGNFGSGSTHSAGKGLSPLARGKRRRDIEPESRQRPIPAGAGETASAAVIGRTTGAYPRWRGGNSGTLI